MSTAQEGQEAKSTTPQEDPAEKRRKVHQKYNQSAKGQKRNRRYEEKHPSRKLRWENARNALRPGGAP
jgi:hypothetical protein